MRAIHRRGSMKLEVRLPKCPPSAVTKTNEKAGRGAVPTGGTTFVLSAYEQAHASKQGSLIDRDGQQSTVELFKERILCTAGKVDDASPTVSDLFDAEGSVTRLSGVRRKMVEHAVVPQRMAMIISSIRRPRTTDRSGRLRGQTQAGRFAILIRGIRMPIHGIAFSGTTCPHRGTPRFILSVEIRGAWTVLFPLKVCCKDKLKLRRGDADNKIHIQSQEPRCTWFLAPSFKKLGRIHSAPPEAQGRAMRAVGRGGQSWYLPVL
ncbi:hypothetical protein F5I97DRAFT_1832030 [Phlebopus sp. FC_14]|nr:hypothetical protein F5I97DRAFT_1832030 [Phlebopus sp. FC_14]